MLDDLSSAGLLIRYTVGDRRYLAVPTWKKHQRPHSREAQSVIPEPEDYQTSLPLAPPRQCLGTAKDVTRNYQGSDEHVGDLGLGTWDLEEDLSDQTHARAVAPVDGPVENPATTGRPAITSPSEAKTRKTKSSRKARDNGDEGEKHVFLPLILRLAAIAYPAGRREIADITTDEQCRILDAAENAENPAAYVAKCVADYEPSEKIIARLQRAKRRAQGAMP
jgi:hypothetical protein